MSREGEGRTALVTGGSSGIGLAFADLLAARGYAVVLAARRRDRLEASAADLAARHRVAAHAVEADFSIPDAPRLVVDELAGRALTIDVLINNAGYGVPGRFDGHPWEVHQRFLQVMVTAVCELSYRLLPGMLERRWGRIVNVSSLAGHLPAPAGHTLYAASKAFLIRFSEALHAERAADGIHTTALCPGFTYTEFHDVMGTRAKVSQMPTWLWMQAPDAVEEGWAAVMRGDPVVVPGRINRTIVRATRMMPQGLARRVASGTGRRYRKSD